MADDPSKSGGSDILDQSEIDRLLAATDVQAKQTVFRADGRRLDGQARGPRSKPTIFAIRSSSPRSSCAVRILHEDFIRYLSARLSLFLPMEFTLNDGENLRRLNLSEIRPSRCPAPTHLCLFKAEPLFGIGILDINPRLALTIADRMLGRSRVTR